MLPCIYIKNEPCNEIYCFNLITLMWHFRPQEHLQEEDEDYVAWLLDQLLQRLSGSSSTITRQVR